MQLLQQQRAAARSTLGRLAIAFGLGTLGLLSAHGAGAEALDTSPRYALGAGVQASYFHCDSSCIWSRSQPSSRSGSLNGLALRNFTLSGTGSVTTYLKLTLAGQYTGTGQAPGTHQFDLLIGIARFELFDQLNIWIGRFFTPSDRINLDGPFFTNDLTPFVNEVDASYPEVRFGADNGIAYWGDFGMLKVSLGAFDGHSLHSAVRDKSTPLAAARLMLDFWDKEEGYLLRSSSYGNSNVLALALAGQSENGRSAWDVDGLLERKLPNAAVITSEFEYQQDRALAAPVRSSGWFLLTSYLLPQRLGIGQLQPLIKYSRKTFDAAGAAPVHTLSTLEGNLNYVMNGANALVGLYYLKQRNVLLGPGSSGSYALISPQEFGLKIQIRI